MVVGLTNGCFDPIHIGHIYNLSLCKCYVDYLIIALNSDESVKRLKGEKRPYQNQYERKFCLSSLRFVNSVKIFSTEEELEGIVKKYKPTYMFKGKEYEQRRITGQDFLESYGGKVIFLKEYGYWHSTNIIPLLK